MSYPNSKGAVPMLLAVEATDRGGSIALARDDRIVDLVYENSQVTHSERLMPTIDELLEKRDVDYEDLGEIAVARGPGSFTAIRLAVTTAKSLAMVCDADLHVPSTLRVMAEYARGPGSLVTSVLDARRGEYYVQSFRFDEDGTEPVDEPHLVVPEELSTTEESLVVFRGRDQDRPDFEGTVLPEAVSRPLASGLVSIATSTDRERVENPDAAAPCYVRKSDAQRSQNGAE
jgi:tRNA threonylcarbamoyladenosine biosynthesis protein TsaB